MNTPRKRRGDCTIYDTDPEMRKIKERDELFAAQELELLAEAMRDDSLWTRLDGGQRAKVFAWLFEENLTYAEAVERVKSELGLETSVSGMGRLYRCLARTRQRIDLLEAQSYARLANSLPGTTPEMRAATMKLLAAQAIRRATEKPDSLEDLLTLAKVLLASEENEIRLRRVKLEEETFDFESGMARGGEVDKVKMLLQQIHENRTMNASEKAEQVKKVREYLFGPDEPEEAVGADAEKKGGGLSE